jgi:superfamily II DNA or RNA helicase
MVNVIFDYDSSRKKGIIVSDYLSNIREFFSIEDRSQVFKRRFAVGYRPQTRQYCITPQGRFEPRLVHSIIEFLQGQDIELNIEITDSFRDAITVPALKEELVNLKFSPRDYQEESVKEALKNKSGIIVLPTSAGKTLVIALLVKSIQQQHNVKTLILVPDIQLVAQTYSDFLEYGLKESEITKWTGSTTPNKDAKIIISNAQILLSEKQDLSLLKSIKLLIIDEVHKLRHGNKINKIIDQIPAVFRYGLTGTLPDNKIDQWNIFGKLGKVIYHKRSVELREKKFISDVNVGVIKLHYKNVPIFTRPTMQTPTAGYEEEILFLQTNSFRNETIGKIVVSADKNILVLVDRISHGELLYDFLKQKTNKQIYFVQGSVDIEEREKIRNLMETQNDIVCVAISKIFSTGINIKNLHYIIFAAIGKAKIKIIQSIGRSLRLHSTKKTATILDIGDNLRYGNSHLMERLALYENEKIPYTIKEIQEP